MVRAAQRSTAQHAAGPQTAEAPYGRWGDGSPRREAWDIVPFSEDPTNYQHEYPPKRSAREQYRPLSAAPPSQGPLDASTSYGEAYRGHGAEAFTPRRRPPQQAVATTGAGLDALSVYAQDYPPKAGEPARRAQRADRPVRSDAPLDAATTYGVDYAGAPGERPALCRRPHPALPAEPFTAETSYAAEYSPKRGERPERVRPRDAPAASGPAGAGHYDTVYGSDYHPQPLSVQRAVRPPAAAHQAAGPIDASTSYGEAYRGHGTEAFTPRRRPPQQSAAAAGVPLDAVSSYAQDYTAKSTERTRRVPREERRHVGGGALDAATTYGDDYVPKVGERAPRSTRSAAHVPVPETRDWQTTTGASHTGAPGQRTQCRRPAAQPRERQPFSGETSYAAEYSPKRGERAARARPRTPPARGRFADGHFDTVYGSDFQPRPLSARQPRPKPAPPQQSGPLEASTSYGEAYRGHGAEAFTPRRRPPQQQTASGGVPLDAVSSYAQDYTAKSAERTRRVPREERRHVGGGALDAATTYGDDYVPKVGERAPRSVRSAAHAPVAETRDFQTTAHSSHTGAAGERSRPARPADVPREQRPFSGETSYAAEYSPKRGERAARARPRTPQPGRTGFDPGHFDTAYSADYTPKQGGRAERRAPPPSSQPTGGPFDGVSCYAQDFTAKTPQPSQRRQYRDQTHRSGGPLDATTTYGGDFTPKVGERAERPSRGQGTHVSGGALAADTTYGTDFTQKDAAGARARPVARDSAPVPRRPFAGETEYAAEYSPKRGGRSGAIRGVRDHRVLPLSGPAR